MAKAPFFDHKQQCHMSQSHGSTESPLEGDNYTHRVVRQNWRSVCILTIWFINLMKTKSTTSWEHHSARQILYSTALIQLSHYNANFLVRLYWHQIICPPSLAKTFVTLSQHVYKAVPEFPPWLQVNNTRQQQNTLSKCSAAVCAHAALHFRTDLTTAQDIGGVGGGCRTYLWLVWVASAWTLDWCTFCSPEYVAGLSSWRFGFLWLGHSFGSTKDSTGLPPCEKSECKLSLIMSN